MGTSPSPWSPIGEVPPVEDLARTCGPLVGITLHAGPAGRLRAVDGSGGVWRLEAGASGELRSVQAPDGALWQWVRRHDRREIRVSDPLGQVTTLWVDQGGALVERTDPEGRHAVCTRDANGDLSVVEASDGTLAVPPRALDAVEVAGAVGRRSHARAEGERDRTGRTVAGQAGNGIVRAVLDAGGLPRRLVLRHDEGGTEHVAQLLRDRAGRPVTVVDTTAWQLEWCDSMLVATDGAGRHVESPLPRRPLAGGVLQLPHSPDRPHNGAVVGANPPPAWLLHHGGRPTPGWSMAAGRASAPDRPALAAVLAAVAGPVATDLLGLAGGLVIPLLGGPPETGAAPWWLPWVAAEAWPPTPARPEGRTPTGQALASICSLPAGGMPDPIGGSTLTPSGAPLEVSGSFGAGADRGAGLRTTFEFGTGEAVFADLLASQRSSTAAWTALLPAAARDAEGWWAGLTTAAFGPDAGLVDGSTRFATCLGVTWNRAAQTVRSMKLYVNSRACPEGVHRLSDADPGFAALFTLAGRVGGTVRGVAAGISCAGGRSRSVHLGTPPSGGHQVLDDLSRLVGLHPGALQRGLVTLGLGAILWRKGLVISLDQRPSPAAPVEPPTTVGIDIPAGALGGDPDTRRAALLRVCRHHDESHPLWETVAGPGLPWAPTWLGVGFDPNGHPDRVTAYYEPVEGA